MRASALVLLVFVCCCLQWHTLKAQDSIVRFSDLHFEKGEHVFAFKALQSNKQLTLAMLLAPYGAIKKVDTTEASEQINELLLKIKKKIARKSPKQQMDILADVVHQSLFTHYVNHNTFSSIFVNGEYNCVSSAALYALLLNGLGIPYEIRQRPEHVYLVAYPNSYRYVLETTSSNGTFTYSDNFISRYVERMENIGVISSDERKASTEQQLFQKYYYSSTPITMRELLAIQYRNFAIYFSTQKKYEEADEAYTKALYIFNAENTRFQTLNNLLVLYNNNNSETEKQMKVFEQFVRFPDLSSDKAVNTYLLDSYSNLMFQCFVKEAKEKQFEAFHARVIASTRDQKFKKEIEYYFHFNKAVALFEVDSTYKDIKPHLTKAYAADTSSAKFKELLFSCLLVAIKRESTIDGVKKTMSEFESDFTFLKNDVKFQWYRSDVVLMQAYQAFELSDTKEGETALQLFREMVEAKPDVKFSEELLEKTYSTATICYYKKGNTAKAKSTAKEGLKYLPNNFTLKRQLSQL